MQPTLPNNNNNNNYNYNNQEFINSLGVNLENISEEETKSIFEEVKSSLASFSLGVNLENISNDSTSLIKTKVDNWIDRTATPQLSHTAILRECEQMTPAENLEMIQYAAQLIQDRLNELNENMRLTWIVRDNLLTLTTSRILMFGQSVLKIEALMISNQGSTISFIPFGLYENLLRLHDAIQMHDKPSNNLLILKNELPTWQEYFDCLAETMPYTITSCDKSFSTNWHKINIPKFISALWEENKIFKIVINGNTCFFHAISKDTCSYYFSEYKKADILFNIINENAFLQIPGIKICEELNQFSNDAQNEFNASLEIFTKIIEKEQSSIFSNLPLEFQQILKSCPSMEKLSESDLNECIQLIQSGKLDPDKIKEKFRNLSAEDILMLNAILFSSKNK